MVRSRLRIEAGRYQWAGGAEWAEDVGRMG